MSSNKKWISGIDLAANADILLHDAQYSSDEYKERKGWGHSSIEDAISFASTAGVKKLLLAHHDPSHTDKILDTLLDGVREKIKTDTIFELAAEGIEINMD